MPCLANVLHDKRLRFGHWGSVHSNTATCDHTIGATGTGWVAKSKTLGKSLSQFVAYRGCEREQNGTAPVRIQKKLRVPSLRLQWLQKHVTAFFRIVCGLFHLVPFSWLFQNVFGFQSLNILCAETALQSAKSHGVPISNRSGMGCGFQSWTQQINHRYKS